MFRSLWRKEGSSAKRHRNVGILKWFFDRDKRLIIDSVFLCSDVRNELNQHHDQRLTGMSCWVALEEALTLMLLQWTSARDF